MANNVDPFTENIRGISSNASSSDYFNGIQNMYHSQGLLGDLLDPEQKRKNELADNAQMWRMEAAYNSASEQMQRAMDAGINANTAAGGIVGNGTDAAEAVPADTSQGQAAQTVGTLSSALNSGVGAAVDAGVGLSTISANKARASYDTANADAIEKRLQLEKLDTFQRLMTSIQGVTKDSVSAAALAMDVANGGIDRMVDYLQSMKELREADVRVNNAKLEYDKAVKYYEEYYDRAIEAAISVDEKTALRNEKEAKLLEEQQKFEKLKNDEYKAVPGSTLPGYQSLRFVGQTYGYDSPEWNNFCKAIYDSSYQESLGRFNADVLTSYNRMYHQLKAQAEWQPYLDRLEEKKAVIMNLIDLCYGMSDDAITNVVKAFLLNSAQLEDPSILTGDALIPSATPPIENGVNRPR